MLPLTLTFLPATESSSVLTMINCSSARLSLAVGSCLLNLTPHLISFGGLLVLDIQGCGDADLGWDVQQRLFTAFITKLIMSEDTVGNKTFANTTHIASKTLVQNGRQQPSVDDSIMPAQASSYMNDNDGGRFIVLDECKWWKGKH